jgi:hypothetical protein
MVTTMKCILRFSALGFSFLLTQANAYPADKKLPQIEIPRETRTLRVATETEGTPVAPEKSWTIFSARGAGSVERIQFAAMGDAVAQESSTITITVDGVSYSASTACSF